MQVIVAHTDKGGTVQYYSTIVADITKRKQVEDKLQYEATHDTLTGALNRAAFAHYLGQQLALVRQSGGTGAVLHLDLDKFKNINDNFGHHVGDAALQHTVRVVRWHLRNTDKLARLGGDEFAIVLPQTTREEAELIGRRLIAMLQDQVVYVGQHAVEVRASMGMSMYPEDADTVEELLIRADKAMYAAKREGGGRLSGYEQRADN